MSDLAEYYQLVNLERCQKPDRKGGHAEIEGPPLRSGY